MTPNVIERLREAMIEADGQIESACAAYERGLGSGGSEVIGALNERRSALAAVEQEMAAKDAEIAELRKRPTLEEVDAVVERVGYAVDDAMKAVQASLRSVGALYARAGDGT